MDVLDDFYARYGRGNAVPETWFAPGRVNLIGEHTDYNGGVVLPCALTVGTTLLVRRGGYMLRFQSANFDLTAEVDPRKPFIAQHDAWINYPLGVMEAFSRRGHEIPAMELLFSGNIPHGAGLSSSASVELAMAVALNDLLDAQLPMMELVKMCQWAENHFVGMNCGIMDQFAVGMGRRGMAMMLQCDTLKYHYAPLQLGDYRLVIANTNKRRGLTDSKYNERRAECEAVVELLRRHFPLTNLSAIGVEQWHAVRHHITDDTLRRRANHVITENHRVEVALQRLTAGDLPAFGELMNASHHSLQHDYEVTGVELDTLAYCAQQVDGVAGSRMTGAGFGGCTVSVVHHEALDEFRRHVATTYEQATGLSATFYLAEPGDGAHKMKSIH